MIGPGIVPVTVAIPFAAFEARDAPRIAVNIYVAVTMLRAHIIIMKFQFVMAHILRAGSIAIRVSASTLRHNKYQLLIQRLVLFFYPMVARKPLLQGLSRTFSRKGILNQLHFSLRKQAWKAKLLSAPVFFTPPLSKWNFLSFVKLLLIKGLCEQEKNAVLEHQNAGNCGDRKGISN